MTQLEQILLTEADAVGVDAGKFADYDELALALFRHHHAALSTVRAQHERDMDEVYEKVAGAVDLLLKRRKR